MTDQGRSEIEVALRAEAARWLAAEPDSDIRNELEDLLDGPADVLATRFTGRVQFGTAGLRAPIGAGPQRMNRLVVRQATAGLVEHILRNDPDAEARGVLIGYDARHKSDVFALEAARVCAAAGVRTMLFDTVVPTPVLAWSVTAMNAAIGVMITASHNPAQDNGYKVYLASGAQIVSPIDAEIAACIDLFEPDAVALAAPDDATIEWVGRSLTEAYLDTVRGVPLSRHPPSRPVAYTALHGVGGATVLNAFARLGWPAPLIVREQQRPDAAFPTVAFPNPEEPGAMDLVIELAAGEGATLAIANDPDGDRLGAAIPTPDGGWRTLHGDEIGWLLANHILRHTTGADRLVVTTLVSSSLLGQMAQGHGVHYAETFTGFKWIARAAAEQPELRLVFAYEQALGYLVARRPLDKDGITAAVMLADVAAVAEAEGVTLQQRLDDLAAEFGRHVSRARSLRLDPADGAVAVRALRDAPPDRVGDAVVIDVEWFEEAGLLRLRLGSDLRIQVRPSGTEPKVKFYGEGIDCDPAAALDAMVELFEDLRARR